MIDFRKAFFPTEEEQKQQDELLHNLYEGRVARYTDQGYSREEAVTLVVRDTEEFMRRGYYS